MGERDEDEMMEKSEDLVHSGFMALGRRAASTSTDVIAADTAWERWSLMTTSSIFMITPLRRDEREEENEEEELKEGPEKTKDGKKGRQFSFSTRLAAKGESRHRRWRKRRRRVRRRRRWWWSSSWS